MREQVGAVALDERDERLPFVVVGESLDDAQPQRAAVGEPAVELRFGEVLQRLDEHRVGRARGLSWVARGGALCVPIFGRVDERADDRLVAAGEQAVVFGDRAGADGVIGFHRLGEVEQLARFADEAQSRQPAEEVVEQLAERAGADDAARLAALGERHVEQLLLGEPLDERGPVARCGGGVAGQHAAEHVDRARRRRPRTCSSAAHSSPPVVVARISRPALAVSTQVAMMCSSSESLIIRCRSNSTIDSCEPLGLRDRDSDGRLRPAPAACRAATRPAGTSSRAARGARLSWRVHLPGDGDVPPEPGDRGQELQSLAEALGFFFQLELAAVGVFVDDVGVEAVVGAVAVDHVFVGGAVELLGLVVLPRARRRPRRRRRRGLRSSSSSSDSSSIGFEHRSSSSSSTAASLDEFELGHLPVDFGAGFQVLEELGHERPLVGAAGVLVFFDGPQPAERERMERGVAIFERRVFDLADPLQHEGHRGDAVAALEQRFDDQLKRFGRIELIDEHPPEFHVAGGSAGLVPGGRARRRRGWSRLRFLCRRVV